MGAVASPPFGGDARCCQDGLEEEFRGGRGRRGGYRWRQKGLEGLFLHV